MSSLPSFLNFVRRPRRSAMDERLPDGRTVTEAAMRKTPAPVMPAESAPQVTPAADDAAMTAFQQQPQPAVAPEQDWQKLMKDQREQGAPAAAAGAMPSLNGMPEENRSKTPPPPELPDWYKAIKAEQDKLAALEADENPEDRNGRGMSILQGLGRGFVNGGARGAIVEAARSAFAPNADERISRDKEKVKSTGRISRMMGQRKADAEYEQTVAQTEELKSKPVREAEKRAQEGKQKTKTALLQQIRTTGRYKRGENPALDTQLDQAGLSVSDHDRNSGKFTWHESGGRVFTMNSKDGAIQEGTANGAPVVDASKVPNPDGLTPAQAALAKFRTTKLYADIEKANKDRASREGIATANRSAANQRSANSIASAEKRALTGHRFKLGTLAIQAEREGKPLDDLVKEIDSLGGEIYDDKDE